MPRKQFVLASGDFFSLQRILQACTFFIELFLPDGSFKHQLDVLLLQLFDACVIRMNHVCRDRKKSKPYNTNYCFFPQCPV
jgi:hypothetical protein